MITFYMNLTRTKYKSTNTTSSETTGSLFYLYHSQECISKINNLRFASSRALKNYYASFTKCCSLVLSN